MFDHRDPPPAYELPGPQIYELPGHDIPQANGFQVKGAADTNLDRNEMGNLHELESPMDYKAMRSPEVGIDKTMYHELEAEAAMAKSREDAQWRDRDSDKMLAGSMMVGSDGRVDIDFNSKLARTISLVYRNRSVKESAGKATRPDTAPSAEASGSAEKPSQQPRLNVLIQVVGSRGDVQPFIALGNELQRLGHRVRLASHDTFRYFVEEAGLEFYPVGGDPVELMAYMVRHPGLIPSFQSLRAGEIQAKRDMIEEMLEGFWYSCYRPDTVTGAPFVADAIIANPPSFAHIHCAEALSVPVHVMFTMPATSTSEFPHPLANLSNGGEKGMTNMASYAIVEYLTWQGLGPVINRWRRSIDLQPIAMFDGPMLAERLEIPFTYCWSPALVAKPADWGAHIDVCGFFFRNAPKYTPPDDLTRFLEAGTPPVYIGFGSIVVENPEAVIETILEAVKSAGVRAIVSRGWSNLAGTPSDNVYWIGDCPHEWLFEKVSVVVHHGGAGTTACGLRNGVPTVVVPFFGDQPFWGKMVANAGAGPEPIPIKQLTSERLAEGIKYCLTPEVRAAAASIEIQMKSEHGVQAAAQSWLRQLPQQGTHCDMIPSQPAAWLYKKGKQPIKLSKFAAEELVFHKAIEAKHLDVFRSKPLNIDVTRWDPISGGLSSGIGATADINEALFGIFTKPVTEYKHEKRRREREIKRASRQLESSHSQDRLDTASTISGPTLNPSSSQATNLTSFDAGKPKEHSTAATVAGASAKSFGMIVPKTFMAVMDIPIAFNEGTRVLPGRLGGRVRDHGPVTGAASGAIVAGKSFAWGIADGITDLFVEPVRGGMKEGAVGVAKGIGRGMVGVVTKPTVGVLGMITYPTAGIAASVRNTVRDGTGKLIEKARRLEGQWLRERGLPGGVNGDALLKDFLRMKSEKAAKVPKPESGSIWKRKQKADDTQEEVVID